VRVSSFQLCDWWHHVGGPKLALMGVFIPWKLAEKTSRVNSLPIYDFSSTNQSFKGRENLLQELLRLTHSVFYSVSVGNSHALSFSIFFNPSIFLLFLSIIMS
jgi:hypothetical protein